MHVRPIGVADRFWRSNYLRNDSSGTFQLNPDSGRLSDLLTREEKDRFARIAQYFASAYPERQIGELALAFAMDKIMAIKSGRGPILFDKRYLEHVERSIIEGHGSYRDIELPFIEALLNDYNQLFG